MGTSQPWLARQPVGRLQGEPCAEELRFAAEPSGASADGASLGLASAGAVVGGAGSGSGCAPHPQVDSHECLRDQAHAAETMSTLQHGEMDSSGRRYVSKIVAGYRDKWVKVLDLSAHRAMADPRSRDSRPHDRLQRSVINSITSALQLKEVGRSRRSDKLRAIDEGDRAPPLRLHHRMFVSKNGRERLQYLLGKIFFAKKIGFHTSLVTLAAMLMAVFEHEKLALAALDSLYDRMELSAYYSTESQSGARPSVLPPGAVRQGIAEEQKEEVDQGRKTTMITKDCELVWAEVESLFPVITGVFTWYDAKELFHEMVKDWLLSLLATGFNGSRQELEQWLPLLDRLVSHNKCDAEDPRRRLRYIVTCIVGRHCNDFKSVRCMQDLEQLVEQLRSNVFADQALLDLMDWEVDPDRVSMLMGAMLLPHGAAWGSFTIGRIAETVVCFKWGIGAAVVFPTTPLMCGLAGALLGGVAGAMLGAAHGRSLFTASLEEVMAIQEDDGNAGNESSEAD